MLVHWWYDIWWISVFSKMLKWLDDVFTPRECNMNICDWYHLQVTSRITLYSRYQFWLLYLGRGVRKFSFFQIERLFVTEYFVMSNWVSWWLIFAGETAAVHGCLIRDWHLLRKSWTGLPQGLNGELTFERTQFLDWFAEMSRCWISIAEWRITEINYVV